MLKRARLVWLLPVVLLFATPAWAGSTAVTGELVYPTQNDLYGANVGGAVGDGKKLLESQWRKIAPVLSGGNNRVLTGGTLPASDPDLTMQVDAGTAVIDGSYVQWPNTNVTLPASTTSHLFLKLVFGGGLVTGVEIEDNTTGTAPASATKLGTATTSGTAVTATTDARVLSTTITPLTSGSSWTVPAGITLIRVRVYGAGGGGGEGGDVSPATGNNGAAGGTTTFGSSLVSAGGGGGGTGGTDSGATVLGQHGGDSSTGIGQIVVQGGGMPGGLGGHGEVSGMGGRGGRGAYAESLLAVTPNAAYTLTFGAGGAGGAGASSGNDGSAGTAGKIIIEYP